MDPPPARTASSASLMRVLPTPLPAKEGSTSVWKNTCVPSFISYSVKPASSPSTCAVYLPLSGSCRMITSAIYGIQAAPTSNDYLGPASSPRETETGGSHQPRPRRPPSPSGSAAAVLSPQRRPSGSWGDQRAACGFLPREAQGRVLKEVDPAENRGRRGPSSRPAPTARERSVATPPRVYSPQTSL